MTHSPQDKNFNWKIAGEAGHGVMLSSELMARAAKRHGMNAFNYLEYPSLIRGGHQTGQVFADFNHGYCQHRDLDVIVIYTQEGFEIHQDEITDNTIIIYNTNFGELKPDIEQRWEDQLYQLPLSTWAKDTAGTTLAANVVSLGVSAYVLGLDPDIFKQIIADQFAAKSQQLVEKNQQAFDLGYSQAEQTLESIKAIEPRSDNQILINGNEAVGLGALAAGIQFYSAYPMTPATGLLHFLSDHKDEYPLVVKQTEDEIGAITEAIGASTAGVRAATGTSGGGFALMVEALSFAGMAEVPLVILEGQRTGPSSGVPTWTAQADLQFVLTAGHGDFPKVVLTPGSVEEHFQLAKQAFYLAEKYQLPVIILSDKYLLESHQTMPEPEPVHHNQRLSMVDDDKLGSDTKYLRYQHTKNGISPRTLPGQEYGLQLTNSYEHDQWGFATEDAAEIKRAVDKRARKLETLESELPKPQLLGPKQAETTMVGWGSTVNVLRELLELAPEGSVNVIHLPCLLPFPAEKFRQLAEQASKLVMVEGNQSGQGESLIRQETGVEMDDYIRRYDGRPFYAEDLLQYLQS